MRSLNWLMSVVLGVALVAIACEDDKAEVPGAGGTPASSGTGGKVTGPSAGSSGQAGASGGKAGSSSAGASGSAGEAGAPGGSGTSPRHLYVGCADAGTGTLESFLVKNAALTALPVITTGGNISNSTLNAAETLMYVAHQVATGPGTRITTFARNASTGALTPLGDPADVPLTAGAGGAGAGGVAAGGAGAGGVAAGGAGAGGVAAGGAGAGGVAAGGVAAGGVAAGGAPNPGAQPQTLTLDGAERFLTIPNYNADSVYVYQLLSSGAVGPLVSSDAGGDKAHDAVFSNNGKYLLVPYLGSNKIRVYSYDQATGAIALDSDLALPVADSGPRHLALHANGSWLYAINETSAGTSTGSIDFLTFDEADGDLTAVTTVPVPLPAGYTGSLKNGSEITIAPSGKFLYVSMRLDNMAIGSLVIYAIDQKGGLTLVDQVSSRGITPRHFSLSKDGKLMVIANQNSKPATIQIFSVDSSTGALAFVTEREVCASPRFARFAGSDD